MAHINLLPWRAERRKLREREFYMMLLATAVGAFVVLIAAILWMNHLIDDQSSRNTYLQEQIKGLDKQIEEIKELDKTRSQLLTRKEIIEQLQSNRSQMVHLFDEMVKTIPDGVRLISMKQAGEVLTLEGVAESNSRVASYMRNIDVSPWMGHTDLRKIENQAGLKDADKKMPYVFSLDVKLRKPQDAQDGGQVASAGGAANAGVAATAAATAAPGGAKKPGDSGAQPGDASSKPVPAGDRAAPAPQPTTTPATGEKK
ncbi:PilN domain-containing protein [Dokdonella soli]|uniref:PilN domain-containing protein n=1 Tax=Dokdonella soli TaxID=529810 RepID=A0ABN1IQ19_9GAMM